MSRVTVCFEFPRKAWFGSMGDLCRTRMRRIAKIEFPEDTVEAVVRVGPMRRDSIECGLVLALFAEYGIHPRELHVPSRKQLNRPIGDFLTRKSLTRSERAGYKK